jgi:hypothetical protein
VEKIIQLESLSEGLLLSKSDDKNESENWQSVDNSNIANKDVHTLGSNDSVISKTKIRHIEDLVKS